MHLAQLLLTTLIMLHWHDPSAAAAARPGASESVNRPPVALAPHRAALHTEPTPAVRPVTVHKPAGVRWVHWQVPSHAGFSAASARDRDLERNLAQAALQGQSVPVGHWGPGRTRTAGPSGRPRRPGPP